MQYGRTADLDGVDFSLPPLDERSRAVLARPRSHTPDDWLSVGAPVWARRDFVGRLYPKGTSGRGLLRAYAERLGAIELNATYYALPSAETVQSWVEDTPASFRFCPKVPRSISHDRALEDTAALMDAFWERLEPLGLRLGPALMQLPPWFTPDRLHTLAAFLERVPRGRRIAVELRHPAWFVDRALRPEASALLGKHGAAAAVSDVAGRRDACHASITAAFAFVRFAGNDLHPSDGPRFELWIDRLLELRRLGLAKAYFFVHQPDDGLAPASLVDFVSRARARGLALPALSLDAPPAQLSLV